MKLDMGIPIEDTGIGCTGFEGVKVMYTLFEDYTEGNVSTASIKFLYEDGTESKYYHPPKDTVE